MSGIFIYFFKLAFNKLTRKIRFDRVETTVSQRPVEWNCFVDSYVKVEVTKKFKNQESYWRIRIKTAVALVRHAFTKCSCLIIDNAKRRSNWHIKIHRKSKFVHIKYLYIYEYIQNPLQLS